MAYIFLAFAHLEAMTGIVALIVVTGILIGVGYGSRVRWQRSLIGIAGFLLYVLLAQSGYHADKYIHAIEHAPTIGPKIALMALPLGAGVFLAYIIIGARRGNLARNIAILVSGFALATVLHGYACLWLDGLTQHISLLLPFIILSGASAVTAVILLYQPAEE